MIFENIHYLTDDERKDKVYYVYDDNEGYEGGGSSDKFTRNDLQ